MLKDDLKSFFASENRILAISEWRGLLGKTWALRIETKKSCADLFSRPEIESGWSEIANFSLESSAKKCSDDEEWVRHKVNMDFNKISLFFILGESGWLCCGVSFDFPGNFYVRIFGGIVPGSIVVKSNVFDESPDEAEIDESDRGISIIDVYHNGWLID